MDLLAKDSAKLGTTWEIGEKTACFFQMELENTWGAKHLAVFEDEEAKNWVLSVSVQLFPVQEFDLELAI